MSLPNLKSGVSSRHTFLTFGTRYPPLDAALANMLLLQMVASLTTTFVLLAAAAPGHAETVGGAT
jgi:hypothetical protein